MKPIHCAFHPKQQIVNFCRNSSCLLPMCPNCVKVHSRQHRSENTFGEFQNIHDVYQQVDSNLQNVVKALGNFSEDLQQVFCQKKLRRQVVKKRMSEYRVKILSVIQRCIDQLQIEILSSMGGQESNVEEEFKLINQKMQALSQKVKKEFKTLNGEKTLKGIITHLTNNMPDFYDNKLDEIEFQIGQLQSKDISMCKQFRITETNQVTEKIYDLYKSIFVGIIKPVTFKGRDSRISKCSRSRVETTNGFGRTKQVVF